MKDRRWVADRDWVYPFDANSPPLNLGRPLIGCADSDHWADAFVRQHNADIAKLQAVVDIWLDGKSPIVVAGNCRIAARVSTGAAEYDHLYAVADALEALTEEG